MEPRLSGELGGGASLIGLAVRPEYALLQTEDGLIPIPLNLTSWHNHQRFEAWALMAWTTPSNNQIRLRWNGNIQRLMLTHPLQLVTSTVSLSLLWRWKS